MAPTFVLLPTKPAADRVEASRNTMKFFDWVFREGGAAAAEAGFVPLPSAATKAIREAWGAVKAPDGRPVWPA